MNGSTKNSLVNDTISEQSIIDGHLSSIRTTIDGMRVVCQWVAAHKNPVGPPSVDASLRKINNAMKVVMPDYHWQTVNANPIFQSPESADKEHPLLAQPRYVDFFKFSEMFKPEKHKCVTTVILALRQLNSQLKDPRLRQDFEYNHFSTIPITSRNIAFIPETYQNFNTMLGHRGVIAISDLPRGTPLMYSAQYMTNIQWDKRIVEFAHYLESIFDLGAEEALNDARERLKSHACRPAFFKSEMYYALAYGAGNIAALTNHDSTHYNMAALFVPFLDISGRATAGGLVLYSTRHIEKDEQLLIN